MPSDENVVHTVLQPYENAIYDAVHGAWSDYQALQLHGRLLFPSRSRACLVYDFMVNRFIASLANDDTVRVIKRDETAKFIFAQRIYLRLKKANDRGLGSNIPTQAALEFIGQQYSLPGIPEVHKVEIVYLLNAMQTRIEKVVVVARDGDERIWDYVIAAPATVDDAIPSQLDTTQKPEEGVKIKVRNLNANDRKTKGNGA